MQSTQKGYLSTKLEHLSTKHELFDQTCAPYLVTKANFSSKCSKYQILIPSSKVPHIDLKHLQDPTSIHSWPYKIHLDTNQFFYKICPPHHFPNFRPEIHFFKKSLPNCSNACQYLSNQRLNLHFSERVLKDCGGDPKQAQDPHDPL